MSDPTIKLFRTQAGENYMLKAADAIAQRLNTSREAVLTKYKPEDINALAVIIRTQTLAAAKSGVVEKYDLKNNMPGKTKIYSSFAGAEGDRNFGTKNTLVILDENDQKVQNLYNKIFQIEAVKTSTKTNSHSAVIRIFNFQPPLPEPISIDAAPQPPSLQEVNTTNQYAIDANVNVVSNATALSSQAVSIKIPKTEEKKPQPIVTGVIKQTVGVTDHTDNKIQTTNSADSKANPLDISPGVTAQTNADANFQLPFFGLVINAGIQATQIAKFQPRLLNSVDTSQTGIGTIHTLGANIGLSEKFKIRKIELNIKAGVSLSDKERDDQSWSTESGLTKTSSLGLGLKIEKFSLNFLQDYKIATKNKHIFGNPAISTNLEYSKVTQLNASYKFNKHWDMSISQNNYQWNNIDARGNTSFARNDISSLAINYSTLTIKKIKANAFVGVKLNYNNPDGFAGLNPYFSKSISLGLIRKF